MRKIIHINLVLLFLMSLGNYSFGQYKDFNLWTSISVQKELIKNLDLEIEIENRFRNNMMTRDQSFADIGIEYSIKNLSASLIYRFSNVNDLESGYKFANRFTYQIQYSREVKRFEMSLRGRYQNHYVNYFSSEDGTIPQNHLRTRVKLLYNIKGIPIDPFLSYESFVQLNYNEPRLIDKERFSIGANYKINKDNTFGVVFHIQPQSNIPDPETAYILGVKYSYDL